MGTERPGEPQPGGAAGCCRGRRGRALSGGLKSAHAPIFRRRPPASQPERRRH